MPDQTHGPAENPAVIARIAELMNGSNPEFNLAQFCYAKSLARSEFAAECAA